MYALGLMLYQVLVADMARPLAPGWEDDIDDPILRDDIGAATHGNPERAAARLESRFTNDPETKASIELALGNSYFGLSDYANAAVYRRHAVDLLTESRGERDPATLAAEYQLATVLVVQGKFDQGSALLDHADGIAGARIHADSSLSFQAHWAREPRTDWQPRLQALQALVRARNVSAESLQRTAAR